jgi:hypothetical protein
VPLARVIQERMRAAAQEPDPENDARTGELGIQERPGGGHSSEISITVTDPRLNGGRPTNIPLLVQGQVHVDDLLAGRQWTHEQEEIAVQRAVQRLTEGRGLPSYGSIPEAERAAQARSESGASGHKFRAEAEASAAERAAAATLLEGLKEPLFPIQGRRVEPSVMSDAEGVAQQSMDRGADTYFSGAPPHVSRPMETVVPREGAAWRERDRIIDMQESAPDRYEPRPAG